MNPSVTLPELIVPLDFPDLDPALRCVEAIGDAVDFYKIGLELFTAVGPDAVRRLRGIGKRVFLDLKLHDIPETVSRAVRTAAALDVALLTLHAGGGSAMVQAARDAAESRGTTRPRLLAVTVLTSLDAEDLCRLGLSHTPAHQTEILGALARDAGADGVVCSAREASQMRRLFGDKGLIVTPGIRPRGADLNDQKRVTTPEDAVCAGATHLVVGRPITAADDPRAAAITIRGAMRTAMERRD